MWPAGPGDDQARFLADLRALRDEAAIEDDEFAARAHYPSDLLKEAENGPFLPGLPVLSAYVRACEGDVLDWEERWRRLAEVPEDPDLPVRPAGASPAAAAGARAGVSIVPPDVYDPERIRAALRGGHGRSDHNGRSPSGPGISVPARGTKFSDHDPAGWGVGTSRDTDGKLEDLEAGGSQEAGPDLNSPSWEVAGDQAITIANGNHHARHQSRGSFDAAAVEMPDSGERADQFRWLPETELPETEQAPQPTDSEFPWSGLADTEQADDGQKAAAPNIDAMPAGPTADQWTPQRQDEVHKPPERTDFWATSVTAASAGLQLPTAPLRRAEEQASSAAALAESAGTPAAPGPSELAQGLAAAPGPSAGSAAATQSRTSAETAGSAASTRSGASSGSTTSRGSTRSMRLTGSATAKTTSAETGRREKDRFFPARLLVIIIIAALIGSVLVLLLK
jgi:hypothetical protein